MRLPLRGNPERYAAELFRDTMTLNEDATTDGGCIFVQPIPQGDAFKQCPSRSRAEIDCDKLADSSQDLRFGLRQSRQRGM